MAVVDEVFTPIYGKPCWHFEQGYGSFLTMEFGEPHLHIQEPHSASEQASEKVKLNASRRHVWVHGDWYLWIYLCDWRIYFHGQPLADATCTRKVIKKATSELDGQALLRVSVDSSLITTLDFDLGGSLEIVPNPREYGETSELWLLYEPSGKVFTLRADGQYSHEPGDVPRGEETWNPFPNQVAPMSPLSIQRRAESPLRFPTVCECASI